MPHSRGMDICSELYNSMESLKDIIHISAFALKFLLQATSKGLEYVWGLWGH